VVGAGLTSSGAPPTIPDVCDPSATFEAVGDPTDAGPFVFTCEHASNRLPSWLSASASDRVLLGDHWGWDVGARDVTVALVRQLGGQGLLSRFSRLAADLNRDPADPALVVRSIDGTAVQFNTEVDQAEIERRTRRLHHPYHDSVDQALRRRAALAAPFQLLSIHSFTPLYLGRRRPMEIGVLFDDFDEQAWRLEGALTEVGFEAALNAPYSGKPPDNLIYSAQRHGRAHGLHYFELEIRQDLIDTPARASAVAARIAQALQVV
jgi:predicted N-formylglutamate amidohydrolase